MEKKTVTTIQGNYLKVEIHDSTMFLYVKSYLDSRWISVGCSVDMLIGEAIEMGALLEKDPKHKHGPGRERNPWPCNQ